MNIFIVAHITIILYLIFILRVLHIEIIFHQIWNIFVTKNIKLNNTLYFFLDLFLRAPIKCICILSTIWPSITTAHVYCVIQNTITNVLTEINLNIIWKIIKSSCIKILMAINMFTVALFSFYNIIVHWNTVYWNMFNIM